MRCWWVVFAVRDDQRRQWVSTCRDDSHVVDDVRLNTPELKRVEIVRTVSCWRPLARVSLCSVRHFTFTSATQFLLTSTETSHYHKIYLVPQWLSYSIKMYRCTPWCWAFLWPYLKGCTFSLGLKRPWPWHSDLDCILTLTASLLFCQHQKLCANSDSNSRVTGWQLAARVVSCQRWIVNNTATVRQVQASQRRVSECWYERTKRLECS